MSALRYTPAGVPALDLRLQHESEVQEAGLHRRVKAQIKAVALGALADRLACVNLDSQWRFVGFLGSGRSGKSIVFHVQDFQQD